MPAEWEPHEATWLAWPYGDESFAGRIPAVENAYLSMIKALAPGELIRLVVRPEQAPSIVEKLEGASIPLARVNFVEADYVDVWTRDWGPTFVRNGGALAFVKWAYNAYGMKFPDILKDGDVPDKISILKKFERIEAGMIMEGGAIETNGAGVILTTEETLLNPNRNPGMSKNDTEKKLKELLGAETVVWLPHGLVNDHTDGHIDEVARFVSSDTILYAWEDEGENHARLAENLTALKAALPSSTLIPLPLPKMIYREDQLFEISDTTYHPDERAPASYCNFYIGNGAVLAPQFGHPNDGEALAVLKKSFPSRTIVPIDTTDLIYGGGGVHCITQQEPTA
jgi:agmatine deiminase